MPFVAYAAFDFSAWRFYKQVSWQGNGLVKVKLDDQIADNTRADLADLRVIDSNGQETPFKIVIGKAQTKTTDYYPTLLNNTFLESGRSSAILDMGEKGRIANELLIRTVNENFQATVKISGSDDQAQWNILKDNAYIYDYTDKQGGFKSQNTIVNFPNSNYRYLKIELQNREINAVKISAAVVSQKIVDDRKEKVRNLRFSLKPDDANKSTELLIDLEAKNIGTDKLMMEIADQFFNRDVYIYQADNQTDWRFVSRDYVFRYGGQAVAGEKLTIIFPEVYSRYLKVVIKNNDDKPLAISTVKVYSIYREAAFQTEAGLSYRLYYGNPKAGFPQYDLEKYWQYLSPEQASEAGLSAQSDNDRFTPEKLPEKPMSERIPFLLPGSLGVVGLLLLGLVYRFFKK
jgi:hypothetical protein